MAYIDINIMKHLLNTLCDTIPKTSQVLIKCS